MRAIRVVLVVYCACLPDPTIPCGELRCPAHLVCTPGGCAEPDNAAACTDKPDGDVCATSQYSDGACLGGACHPIACGDGIVDRGEVCDDGNQVRGDGCSEACDSKETCGNGVVDLVGGEECDDGIPNVSSDGCSSLCRREIAVWADATPQPLAGTTGPMIAFDAVRGRHVLFGGGTADGFSAETWERIDGTWVRIAAIVSPPARARGAMFYDEVRKRVVLFGGVGASQVLDDTWEWDGVTWTELQLAQPPPPRFAPGLAYDGDRDRAVMFGGSGVAITDNLTDTWEWDGATWTRVEPAASPPARMGPAMTYDAQRKQVVLFGGFGEPFDAGPRHGDTWVYDGTTWSKRQPTASPPAQSDGAMEFDPVRQRVVLFGGADQLDNDLDEHWEWDGTNWTKRVLLTAPAPRRTHALVWDPASSMILCVAGSTFGVLFDDTWQFDGANWQIQPLEFSRPGPRLYTAMTYDPVHGKLIVFGGNDGFGGQVFGDTWELTTAWRLRSPATKPTARAWSRLEFDVARGRAVLFGGSSPDGFYADTWEWDGSSWTDRTPATSPVARVDHAMAYDAARGRIVLFGGHDVDGVYLGDTWEWDGASWVELTPAVSPSPRVDTGLAFDPVRQRVVLFGGFSDAGMYADTWEWDGATWTERIPPEGATTPPARWGHGMTYDPQRGRVVMHGGSGFGLLGDTWEWDGAAWREVDTQRLVAARFWTNLAYDAVHRRVVRFGGSDNTFAASGAVAALEYRSLQSPERCVLATADDDRDGLTGCADPDCWGRCSPLCPPASSCPADAPRCGDGTCDATEDRWLCVADCSN